MCMNYLFTDLGIESTFVSVVQQFHVCFPQSFHGLFQFGSTCTAIGDIGRLLHHHIRDTQHPLVNMDLFGFQCALSVLPSNYKILNLQQFSNVI